MNQPTRGLVIAGTQSGVGKTTVTLGLLYALARRGLTVQPFKVGPDFIDPGHHTRAAGRVCRNLDGWMLSREANLALFRRQAREADVAVVEGVMGLFDGYDGASEAGSTAQMAKWLGLPVLLVVDARAMARSAAALVHGFASFDPALSLAGVVFNRIGSAAHLEYLQQALSSLPGVRCFGGLPRDQELAIPERHLGLATAEDHPLDDAYLGHLADRLETHLDLEGLLAALPRLTLPEEPAPAATPPLVRLGVARDRAFCFYYPENLELLASFGAELVPFSPLEDRELPAGLDGIYLGGGYPELYAEQLAANEGLKQALKAGAAGGLPIYAECGGLMYLAREIRDLEGRVHPMAGVLPFHGADAAPAQGPGLPGSHPDGSRPPGPCGDHGPGARVPLLGNRGRARRRAPPLPADAPPGRRGRERRLRRTPRPGQLRPPPLRQQPRSGPAPGGELPGV